MQKKKQLKKSTYSTFKSLKNRLSFASHKKKSFLDKKENIEILELEDIEVLDFEDEPLGVVEEIEQLEIDEDVKLTKQKIHLKPLVKRRIQYASYALGAFAVLLLTFSFLIGGKTSSITIAKVLAGLGIYTEEIPVVEDVSNDYNNPGSVKVSTTAKWTGLGKAQIKVNLNTEAVPKNDYIKDVILVMDASNTMTSTDYSNVKDGFVDAMKSILSEEENQVALISFNSEATILSSFTRDEEALTNAVNSITPGGASNYSNALKKVGELLNNYTPQENRDLVVIFFAGGASTEGTSSEKGEYLTLKDNYPYITISGIKYYESIISDSINNISDHVFATSKDEIKTTLLEATVNPVKYDKLIVTEYLDEYFTIDSMTNISGNVTITEEGNKQKVVWNFGSDFSTGSSGVLTLNAHLKDEYQEVEDFYPISQSRSIVYKVHDNSEKTMNSTKTPVIKNKFSIIYNTNPPDGCNIEDTITEKQFVFRNVQKRVEELSCEGYLFKGWAIDDSESDDITYINDNTFIMPSRDVHINGTWAKQNITKAMNGTVFEKMSLYDVIAKDAGTAYVKEYTNPHQDSIEEGLSTEKIYYYDGETTTNNNIIKNKNNVIFADHCWQMIRTTDTGGVKMIYNGEVVNGKCLDTRGTHPGFKSLIERTFSNSYYYGSEYLFNKTTNKFSLTGYTTTGEIPVGYYTCLGTSEDDSCSTLYYVSEYTGNNRYLSYTLNTESAYSSFGSIPYNRRNDSLAYIGYMYDKDFKNISGMSEVDTIYNKSNYNADYYFGTDYRREYSNYYILEGDTFTGSSVSDVSELAGTYTLLTKSLTRTTNPPRYVAAVLNNKIYNIIMENDQKINDVDVDYYYGTELTELGNGYYRINSSTPVKRSNWIQYYADVQGKYLCEKTNYYNMNDDVCINPRYVIRTTDTDYNYMDASVNIKFANSFNSYNGIYVLNDNDSIYTREISSSTTISNLETHRYTCWNNSGQCETLSALYYVMNSNESFGGYGYIDITGGLTLDEAVNSMLYNDTVNQKDSIIKGAIDLWYQRYITPYAEYLDDVIYCNDRRMSNSPFFGNPLLKSSREDIVFSAKNQLNSLKCANLTDSFSKTNNVAFLKYPVGLLTNEEAILMGTEFRKTGEVYLIMSPKQIDGINAENKVVDTRGYISTGDNVYVSQGMIYDHYYVNTSGAIRPVVALKKAVDIIGGDGSPTDPYLIDIELFD